MSRRALPICIAIASLGIYSCGNSQLSQPIDVSKFSDFQFSRTIDIGSCFEQGDLVDIRITTQADNRLFEYATLSPVEDTDECDILSDEGLCLVIGEAQSRVLVESENHMIERLFRQVLIASEPHELCGSGNVTLCSDDEYSWDGLVASNDFCDPVHVANAFELMAMFNELKNGPPDESAQGTPLFGGVAEESSLPILRTESIIASDDLLQEIGDFAVISNQEQLDSALLNNGSVIVAFETEIAVAVSVIRPPCEEFVALEALESTRSVKVNATMSPKEDCFLDLGSVDAYLIVLPITDKEIRLFLNNSELEAFEL